MSINFFSKDCQSHSTSQSSFGICDDENGQEAYINTDLSDNTNWIAEVKNPDNLEVIFTAVDKCVIKDNEYPGRGRCDGMLTTNSHLYLVELKNQKPPWQIGAIEQLLSTIEFISANHDLSSYKKKKAFACNKKRKKFVEIDNEYNLKLYRKTGFRIDIQAEIILI